jgi:hypothetical protein
MDHAQILNDASRLPDPRQLASLTLSNLAGFRRGPMAPVLTTRRPVTRPLDLVATVVRALGRVAFAALVAFHAWLLVLQVVEGQALEPAAAVRWALAALVLAGFRAISRRGLPLFVGRRAVGLWLLVVIIHCSAAWDGGAAAALDRAIPESITALAQISFAAASVGLALVAFLARASRPWAGHRLSFAVPALVAGLPSTGAVFRFSPRPPPPA